MSDQNFLCEPFFATWSVFPPPREEVHVSPLTLKDLGAFLLPMLETSLLHLLALVSVSVINADDRIHLTSLR